MKRGHDFDSIDEILSSRTLFGVMTENIHTRTIVPKDILDHLIIQTFKEHMDCKFTEIVWRSTFKSLENADPNDLAFIKGILTVGCSMCGVAGRALWEEDKACSECTSKRIVQVIPSDDGSFKQIDHFPEDSIIHDFMPYVKKPVLPTSYVPTKSDDKDLWIHLTSKILNFFQDCGSFRTFDSKKKTRVKPVLFYYKKDVIDALERTTFDIVEGRASFCFFFEIPRVTYVDKSS
jgi:hypothetical protein